NRLFLSEVITRSLDWPSQHHDQTGQQDSAHGNHDRGIGETEVRCDQGGENKSTDDGPGLTHRDNEGRTGTAAFGLEAFGLKIHDGRIGSKQEEQADHVHRQHKTWGAWAQHHGGERYAGNDPAAHDHVLTAQFVAQPSVSDVAKCTNHVGDDNHQQRARGFDAFAALQHGSAQDREGLNTHPVEYPYDTQHNGVAAVYGVKNLAQWGLGRQFQTGFG